MGVEVGNSDGFEVAPAPFEAVAHRGAVNGDKVSIKFGSQDETVKGGDDKPKFNSDVPKDAVEEWPAPKQIHSFYFIRYRPYEDPKIKAKLDQTDKELQKMNRTRAGIVEELKAKRAERSEIFNQLNPLKSERKGFNEIFDEKKKEMEPLQQALGKLRSNDGGGRGVALCSSEQELNHLIYSLQYRIQHESISLNEEKQILKEIKQLEGTREKVAANTAMRAKIKESLGPKEDLQDQVKLMGVNLDGVRKDRQAVTAKINQLSEKLNVGKDEIQALENELKTVTENRDKVFANLQELRKQRDETNANFYQSRTVLIKARELAANKNVQDLEALAQSEVEKIMSFWNSKKSFRNDYEKRILSSLDARQLSRDGRIRNPDEKPLVAPEAPQKASLPSETKDAPKAKAKLPKEDTNSAPKQDAQKAQKDAANETKETEKVKDTKASSESREAVDEEFYVKPQKKEKVVDEAKLKEMRKQEEVAKAKLALERKKKLAEKAAARAAIRAQKEAEKKIKDLERKAKKKAGVKSTSESETAGEEEVAEAAEPEIEAEVQEKEKPEKERAVREKKPVRIRNRGKGPEALPRAILKRKKSTNYWLYAAPAAVAVTLLLVVLAYYYMI